MKKLSMLLLTLLLGLCITGCGKEPEPEPAPPPPPTFEETVGCTGDELIKSEFQSDNKDISLVAKYKLKEINVNGTVIDHEVTNRMSYETDGFISTGWYIYKDIVDGVKNTRGMTYFINDKDKASYVSYDYGPWVKKSLEESGVYNTAFGDGAEITDFFEKSSSLVVTGSSNALGNSSIDKWVKYVLSLYDIQYGAYTFEAKYDYDTKQFEKVTLQVDVPNDGTLNDNRVQISEMSVTALLDYSDEGAVVGIPAYVIDTAVTEEEQQAAEEGPVFVTSDPLCKSLFGVESNIDAVHAYMDANGLGVNTLATESGLDGASVYAPLGELLTFLSYDDLLQYDYEGASTENKWACDKIKSLCEGLVPVVEESTPAEDEPEETTPTEQTEPSEPTEPEPTEPEPEEDKPTSNAPV